MSFRRKNNPKSAALARIRVTPEDKALIQKKAKDCYLPISEFMVRAALSRQTRSRTDLDLINEIREYIDLVRTIHESGGPAEELRRVLNASVRALCRIIDSRH